MSSNQEAGEHSTGNKTQVLSDIDAAGGDGRQVQKQVDALIDAAESIRRTGYREKWTPEPVRRAVIEGVKRAMED